MLKGGFKGRFKGGFKGGLKPNPFGLKGGLNQTPFGLNQFRIPSERHCLSVFRVCVLGVCFRCVFRCVFRRLSPTLANPILAHPFLAIVFGQPILAKIRG